jgi:outer membrane receptor for ferrienterochelin and colicins
MRTTIILTAAVFISNVSFAQKKDTIVANKLSEVVVTGQFEPQSIKKSVFNVTKITRAMIQQQAANNLADVLNQYLHITITPDSGTGRSTVSMFGLDGNYFKILVDNVPIVGDTGLGNNIDLTQINLDDVEQIEIIEGSMGVTHGANAVSGILNIITKKSAKNKWQISTTLQEETVGNEFALFNKGKHIQGFSVSHSIDKSWFAAVGFNRSDFSGYLDDKKGKDYTETDLKRGFTWLPKLQYVTNGLLSYQKNNFRVFYKLDYLNENIDYYNPSILTIVNPPFGESKYAKDKRYLTERFYHHINASGKIIDLNYNVSLSHQKQSRYNDTFNYDLDYRKEGDVTKVKNQSTEVLYSTGTLSNFFENKKIDLQLGYEAVNNLGFALVDGEKQSIIPMEKRFENYDFFVSTEIKVSDKFAIRSGVRASIQSKFKNQSASSLGLRYVLNNGVELRTSYGKSFRVPVFEELYSKIKFSGHQFYGNENLVPEASTSVDFSIKKEKIYASNFKLSNQLSSSYLDVKDRIDMALVGFESDTSPIYQYINISSYKMWNASWSNQMELKNWKASLGASLVGISQVIKNGQAISDDAFAYNFQLNSNLTYFATRLKTQFAVFYKFNGKNQRFVAGTENNQAVFKRSIIDSSNFLDASAKKSFCNKQFDVTIGARNLLNITQINESLPSGNAHNNSTNILLGYGRSFFIKLTYSLNFK